MIVDDKGIKDCWKEYMEKLMNEENEWDHKISAPTGLNPKILLHAIMKNILSAWW